MNQRGAKRHACAELASQARHWAEEGGDHAMSEADNDRVATVLEELAGELEGRAGD